MNGKIETLGLNESIIKGLSDRSSEKRKQATNEIQKVVLQNFRNGQDDKTTSLVRMFGQQIEIDGASPAQIRGALLGLAGISIALSQQGSAQHLNNLIRPVLRCFAHNDPKVRYTACETMFNIVTICREAIVRDNINDVFKHVIRLVTDVNQDVKRAVQILDQKLKEIVSESLNKNYLFHLQPFIDIICEHLLARNPAVRQMLVSWIDVLDSIPNVDLLKCVPKFLEGLLSILGDSHRDVMHSADQRLKQFLNEFEVSGNRSVPMDLQIISGLLHFLNERDHRLLDSGISRLTAIKWLHMFLDFLEKDFDHLDDFRAKQSAIDQGPLMPPSSYDSKTENEQEVKSFSLNVSHLRGSQTNSKKSFKVYGHDMVKEFAEVTFPELFKCIMNYINDPQQEIKRKVAEMNEFLLVFSSKVFSHEMNFAKIMEYMIQNFEGTEKTKQKIIQWFIKLYSEWPDQVFDHTTEVVNTLLEGLNFRQQDKDLVDQMIYLFDLISKISEEFFNSISQKIIEKLYLGRVDLNTIAIFIIRRLCLQIEPTKIFITFAKILVSHKDVAFLSLMVQTLDVILATDRELTDFRKRLKSHNQELFLALYDTWCYDPVSTVTLCLMSENYELAYHLILRFGGIPIDTETLIQLGHLVQLIESPNFAYLRLQLLSHEDRPYLLKCLQGIMMILPQSKAFTALKTRLKSATLASDVKPGGELPKDEKRRDVVDVAKLLRMFDATLERTKT